MNELLKAGVEAFSGKPIKTKRSGERDLAELKCCGMTFKTAKEYATHAAGHGAGALKCCGMTFNTADQLAQHLQQAHGAP